MLFLANFRFLIFSCCEWNGFAFSCCDWNGLHTLPMMTAESMLSKRPVLRFTAALFFLLKFCHGFCTKALGVGDSARIKIGLSNGLLKFKFMTCNFK